MTTPARTTPQHENKILPPFRFDGDGHFAIYDSRCRCVLVIHFTIVQSDPEAQLSQVEAHAFGKQVETALNALPALAAARLALEAAVAYDEAIKSCANDPAKMASFCSAQGDDLDTLYFEWQQHARHALALLRDGGAV